MPLEYIIEKSAKVQSAKVHFEDILEMVSIAIKIRRLSRADVLTQTNL